MATTLPYHSILNAVIPYFKSYRTYIGVDPRVSATDGRDRHGEAYAALLINLIHGLLAAYIRHYTKIVCRCFPH